MKDALERDTPPLEAIERARAAIEKGAGYEIGSTSEEVISRVARGLAWLWLGFNINEEPTTIDDECRRAARINGVHVDTIHRQQTDNEALISINTEATKTIDKQHAEIVEIRNTVGEERGPHSAVIAKIRTLFDTAARANELRDELTEQTEHADQIALAAEAREVDHRATLTTIAEALGIKLTPTTDLAFYARDLADTAKLSSDLLMKRNAELAEREGARLEAILKWQKLVDETEKLRARVTDSGDLEHRIARLVEELDDARRQSNADLEARRVATAERDNAIAIATENREALDSIARAVGADGKHDTITYDAVCALRDQCSELLSEMAHGANPDALLRAISTARPEPKADEDDGADDEHEPDAQPRSEFVDRVIQATAEILADLLLEQEGRNT